MKKTFCLWLAILFATTTTFAGPTRILDGQAITNGAATLNLPTSTDTLVGKATTDIFTNKSISGSTNTFTNIPLATALTGTLGVSLGGSGTGSFTLNGILFGNGTSAFGVTLAGAQYSILQAGVGGVPEFGAVNLAQGAAVTGVLGITNGGTGGATATLGFNGLDPLTLKGELITHNGTDSVKLLAGTNGFVLQADSAEAGGIKWAAPPSGAVTVTGTRAAPSSITAAGGIAFAGTSFVQAWFVEGNGGAINVTATPQIAAGGTVGQRLTVIGRNAVNTLTLEDGTGLSLNGPWVGGEDSVLAMFWDGVNWVEENRR